MFLILIRITLSLIFVALNHPITFGGILIIQTIIISLTTGLINYNFLYLLLIIVRGILVLFNYITRVSYNEKLKFLIKILFLFIIIFLILLVSRIKDISCVIF